MNTRKLSNVTLLGIDCLDIDRLIVAAEICQLGFDFGDVKLLSDLTAKYSKVPTIPIAPIRATQQYSDFVINRLLDYVNTEYVLIFQYDGFILNPSAWDEKFLEYDYVGAPWSHRGDFVVGNGGFSLRSRKLLKLINECRSKLGGSFGNEDAWICKHARNFLESNGARFAPKDLAFKFSLEGYAGNAVWNDQFGFHDFQRTNISKWLSENINYEYNFSEKSVVRKSLGNFKNCKVAF